MNWRSRLTQEGELALRHISANHDKFGVIPNYGDTAVWGHFVGHFDWSNDIGRTDLACILAETITMECWDRQVLESFFGFVWGVANRTPTRILSRAEWVALYKVTGFVGLEDDLPAPTVPLELFRGAYCADGAGMSWTSQAETALQFPQSDPAHALFRVTVDPKRVLARFRQGQEDEYVLDPTSLNPIQIDGHCMSGPENCHALAAD